MLENILILSVNGDLASVSPSLREKLGAGPAWKTRLAYHVLAAYGSCESASDLSERDEVRRYVQDLLDAPWFDIHVFNETRILFCLERITEVFNQVFQTMPYEKRQSSTLRIRGCSEKVLERRQGYGAEAKIVRIQRG